MGGRDGGGLHGGARGFFYSSGGGFSPSGGNKLPLTSSSEIMTGGSRLVCRLRSQRAGSHLVILFPLSSGTSSSHYPLPTVVENAAISSSSSFYRRDLSVLSRKNLTGNIPLEPTKLTGLVELLLDENSLTGAIPDFSGCSNMELIHLENNALTGEVPSSLANLLGLKELYLQNNLLSGSIPQGLLNKKIIFNENI